MASLGDRQPSSVGRLGGQEGQALPAALGLAVLCIALALGLFQLGRAHLAAAQAQTAADLAALTATRGGGAADIATTRTRAARVAAATGARLESLRFTTGSSGERRPVVVVRATGPLGIAVRARAVGGSGAVAGAAHPVAIASGGGYRGPLVFRDGRPTCPRVAAAFDRMDAAARTDGVDLVVTSGFRSDAEQAVLFRRHPDPRWVAPPGRSRHRDATELDIAGTPGAWGWLASNGPAHGFVQRYSWEPWHWGYAAGCSVDPAGAPR